MNGPGLLPMSQAAAGLHHDSLWEQAPAWRKLTTVAMLLTATTLATLWLLPQMPGDTQRTISHAAVVQNTTQPATTTTAATIVPATTEVAAIPAPHHSRPIAATPAAPAAASAAACSLSMNTAPQHLGSAVVVGIIAHDQSLQVFQKNGQRFGAPVNPAYVEDVRILIHPDKAAQGITRGTLVPAGLHVAVGDRVLFDTAYRDPGLACAWVPTLVTADQGPAEQSAPVAVAAQDSVADTP